MGLLFDYEKAKTFFECDISSETRASWISLIVKGQRFRGRSPSRWTDSISKSCEKKLMKLFLCKIVRPAQQRYLIDSKNDLEKILATNQTPCERSCDRSLVIKILANISIDTSYCNS